MDAREFRESLDREIQGKVLMLKKHARHEISFGSDGMISYIDDGVILTEKNCEDGTLIGTGVNGPGMLLGLTAFNNDYGFISCIPLKNSTLICYRTADVIKLMLKNPEIHFYISRILAGRFRFMMSLMELNSKRSIPERVRIFESMLKEFNDDELLDISDAMLAEFIGAHPSSVSRARAQSYKTD